jgi:hypothetical protein
MHIYLYRVTDHRGVCSETVTVDPYSSIYLEGIQNQNSEYVRFESEPRHLNKWVQKHGLTLDYCQLSWSWNNRQADPITWGNTTLAPIE